jgi:ABC-type sugar transport system ATPase subunit
VSAIRPSAIVDIAGITKTFGHVEALRGVDMKILTGEILALVGDNGAGKSTLVGVLSGDHVPDAGTVLMEGEAIPFGVIAAAQARGISAVYQDLALAPDLSISDNIFLSTERRRPGLLGRLGFLEERQMEQRASELMSSLGIQIGDVRTPVRSLSGGQRQVVAVSRAVERASKLVILDEPTAALGARQARIVLETILEAKRQGLTILLISHDLPRVIEVADRIAIMRLGRVVTILPGANVTIPQVVATMLGESVGPEEGAG